MNDRVQDRIKGAREVLALLSTFKSLSKQDAEEYIKAMKYSPAQLIAELTENNLCFSGKDGTLSECQGAKGSVKGTICFRTARLLCKGKKFYIREAAFPFDYVVSSEDKNYLFLYFNDGGRMRLSFYNHMKKDEGLIPVIIFANYPMDELYEKNELGESVLYPKDDFIIARVSYKNDGEFVVFKEMEGRKDE